MTPTMTPTETKTLTDQITMWYRDGEHEQTILAILALPASKRTDELLGELAVACNNTGQYSMAILVLEEIKSRSGCTWSWQYRMGYALYYSGLKAEPKKMTVLLSRAREAFSNALMLEPPEHIKNDCLEFLEWIQQDLETAAR